MSLTNLKYSEKKKKKKKFFFFFFFWGTKKSAKYYFFFSVLFKNFLLLHFYVQIILYIYLLKQEQLSYTAKNIVLIQ